MLAYKRPLLVTTWLTTSCLAPMAWGGVAQDLNFEHFHLGQAEDEDATVAFAYNDFRFGSGAVIGDRWVLTAAHVVLGAPSFEIDLGVRKIAAESWYLPTAYLAGSYTGGADIALVRLQETVGDIDPYRYNGQGGEYTSWDGEEIKIVGFGNFGEDYWGQISGTGGTRRAGFNRAESDPHNYFHDLYNQIYDLSGKFIVTEFDSDPGVDVLADFLRYFDSQSETDGTWDWARNKPHGLEYVMASGDSGGPDLIGSTVVGIHSWGINPIWAGIPQYSTVVDRWADWITAVIIDPNAAQTTPPAGVSTVVGRTNAPVLSDEDYAAFREMTALKSSDMLQMLEERLLADGAPWGSILDMLNQKYAHLDADDRAERIAAFSDHLSEWGMFHGLATFDPLVEIPEPATLALLAAVGLPMLMRRRRG